jgi:hypothetical protein
MKYIRRKGASRLSGPAYEMRYNCFLLYSRCQQGFPASSIQNPTHLLVTVVKPDIPTLTAGSFLLLLQIFVRYQPKNVDDQ